MAISVRIYSPVKTAMQSGKKEESWVIEFEPGSKQSPEPLMGWISGQDTKRQINLQFPNKDRAIEFAQSKGWQYIVLPRQQRKLKPRNYGDNFVYRPQEEEGKA